MDMIGQSFALQRKVLPTDVRDVTRRDINSVLCAQLAAFCFLYPAMPTDCDEAKLFAGAQVSKSLPLPSSLVLLSCFCLDSVGNIEISKHRL